MRSQLLIFILALIFTVDSGRCNSIDNCFKHLSNINILIEDTKGDVLYLKDTKKNFIPASTIKILTALAGFYYLGEDFRFKTEFYLDRDNNLKIKGYGDPFLISEIWNEIACVISCRLSFINDIIVDDSYFSRNIKIPGAGNSPNPYDAPVGALCVNFNTIYVKIENNRIISAEPQTPFIPFALKLLKGIHRKGRYTISHNQIEAERYAAELFKYFLKRYRVKVVGKIRFGSVKKNDTLIYVYYSKFTLKEIVKNMLKYSNNFIANQIMLVLGAKIYGPPATLKKGISVIRSYAEDYLGLKDISIMEASGISRKNHISYIDMAVILKKFLPYMKLLRKKKNIYYKTGTLKDIRVRAGYILSQKDIYLFILFTKYPAQDIDHIMECIAENIYLPQSASLSPDDLLIR